jgi:hypothetical protein
MVLIRKGEVLPSNLIPRRKPMTTLFKCPLPHNVPGVATIEISESGSMYRSYPVKVLGGHKVTNKSHYRVYFDDFRDGVLYASIIEPVDL